MATRREELVRGWRVLFAATFGCAVGASAYTTATLGFFMPALQKSFDWNRGDVGTAATFFLIGMLIFFPVAGRLCDRYGSRLVALASIGLLAITLGGIGFLVRSLPMFYGGYFAIALGGAGTSFVVYSRAINTWFNSARGLALGIMIAGTGLTTAAAPFILVPAISGWGWRAGYFILSGLSASALIPVAAWFRERGHDRLESAEPASGMALREILKTRQFWTLCVALVFISPVFSGAVVHLVPMYTDMGATATQVKLLSSALGVAMVVARPLIGLMLDRLYAPYVAATALILPAIGLILAKDAGLNFAICYAMALGIGLSAESDLVGYLTSRYFGMRAYAETYGWLFSAATVGFALGPVLVGKVYLATGNYETARLSGAAFCIIGAICFLSLGRIPARPIAQSASTPA